jgi:hypothetical protein
VRIVGKRLAGKRPSPFRAVGAALIAGVGVAVVSYRALRH